MRRSVTLRPRQISIFLFLSLVSAEDPVSRPDVIPSYFRGLRFCFPGPVSSYLRACRHLKHLVLAFLWAFIVYPLVRGITRGLSFSPFSAIMIIAYPHPPRTFFLS